LRATRLSLCRKRPNAGHSGGLFGRETAIGRPADEDVCIFSTFASVLHEILMQVRNGTKLRRYYDAIALYQDLDQVDQECLD
jgi:hypothetical protein